MLENLGMALIKIMLKRLIKVKEMRCFLVKIPTCSGDIACLNHSKIHHQQGWGTSKSGVALRILGVAPPVNFQRPSSVENSGRRRINCRAIDRVSKTWP